MRAHRTLTTTAAVVTLAFLAVFLLVGTPWVLFVTG